MKKKDEKHEARKPESVEDISKFRWPLFFDADKVKLLVQRVQEAADNEVERHVFMSILRRAYEDVMELEILYRELPGVLANDLTAIGSFRKVLNEASAYMKPPRGSRFDSGGQFDYSPNPNAVGAIPCQPGFLVSPSIILLLRDGISRIAQKDNTLYNRYVDTLRGLWDRASHLNRFYRNAHRGIDADGRDRLAEHLRIISRDSRIAGQGLGMRRGGRSDVGEPTGDPFPNDLGGGIPDGSIPYQEEFWPPPPGDESVVWPPDPRRDPDLPDDPCELLEELCNVLVFYGFGRLRTPPVSTYADGITSITPPSACVGQEVTIHGSGFGSAQPANVNVIVGATVAKVISWSDTAIVIEVPDHALPGCVGFLDETLQVQAIRIQAQNQEIVEEINTGLKCLGEGGYFPKLPISASAAPCTGVNYLPDPSPRIDWFKVNGRDGLIVEPNTNTELILTWQISNATLIRIRRVSAEGPPIDVIVPSGNVLNLGIFLSPLRPVSVTYALTATNDCGTISRNVSVAVRKSFSLRILGVEVIQTIQRFSLTNPAQNNSVRLVANKRTMARVYVDSGIDDGFDYGDGPNLISNVTGEIIIWPAGARGGFDCGEPLNANSVVTARPAAQFSRSRTASGGFPVDTLNFELDWAHLSGEVQIEARVWVREGDKKFGGFAGWAANDSSTRVTFHPRRTQNLAQILVQDSNHGIQAPTIAAYNTSLQGARTRYPISDNGFVIYIAPGYTTISTNRDLNTVQGWQDLLDDIEENFADEYEDIGQIWTVLVPNSATYALNGIGEPYWDAWYAFDRHPKFIAQATLQATFAHEMGHTFGLSHAPCGLPSGETPDPRLPGATEDIGIDVPQRLLVPANTSELMSYCTPTWPGATYQNRWPSIAFWDIIFDALS